MEAQERANSFETIGIIRNNVGNIGAVEHGQLPGASVLARNPYASAFGLAVIRRKASATVNPRNVFAIQFV